MEFKNFELLQIVSGIVEDNGLNTLDELLNYLQENEELRTVIEEVYE